MIWCKFHRTTKLKECGTGPTQRPSLHHCKKGGRYLRYLAKSARLGPPVHPPRSTAGGLFCLLVYARCCASVSSQFQFVTGRLTWSRFTMIGWRRLENCASFKASAKVSHSSPNCRYRTLLSEVMVLSRTMKPIERGFSFPRRPRERARCHDF